MGGHRAGRAEPWFVHVSYIRPHPPYRVPAPYHDLYDPAEVPLPVPAPTGRPRSGAQHRSRPTVLGVGVVGAPTDDAAMRQLRATYYGMMTEVDHHLGRLLDWLDETGEPDDTLVVLTSDHGDQMGDHWLIEKLGYWDESYHVPLIVRDPRHPRPTRGSAVDAFTEHVDVMPTILDWLGSRCRSSATAGRSLPFVRGRRARRRRWRTEVHWQWDFRSPIDHVAEDLLGLTMEQCTLDVIRDDRFKYVHFGGMDADPVRPRARPAPVRQRRRRPRVRLGASPTTPAASSRGGCATTSARSPGTSSIDAA